MVSLVHFKQVGVVGNKSSSMTHWADGSGASGVMGGVKRSVTVSERVVTHGVLAWVELFRKVGGAK